MSTAALQDNEFVRVTSTITGRSLLVNLSDTKFLVPPTFSIEEAHQALARIGQYDSGARVPALNRY